MNQYPNQPEYETQSPNPAPTPQPQGSYNHPVYDEKPAHPASRKTLIIAIVAAATLLVLLVGALFLAAMTPKKVVVTQTETVAPTKLAPLTAELTIKHVKSYYAGTATAKTSLSTPIRADGKSFYTVITDEKLVKSVAGAVPIKDASPLLSKLRKSLSTDKFNESVLNSGDANSNFLANYLRDDVVCQLLLDKSNPTSGTYWLEAKCLDMAQYNDLADAQNTLYDIYTPAHNLGSPVAFMGEVRVHPGSTAGYEVAEQDVATVIDGAKTQDQLTAQYYRGAGKAWTYFTNQPLPIDCSLYSSEELKTIFQGTPCINMMQHTTEPVPAPKPNR